MQMPNNGPPAAPPPVPNPPGEMKAKPVPNPPAEKSVENLKSKLNPQDTAALDTLFSELDGNFRTSYDLSQMTSQVTV